ncbi:ferritin-like domain-containing protein [Autumnicola musiva]|uniref:PA2169 family four-helix-bundle protein n=1 Tax=Autumnicola musiva TaxID=3075589 RepID=A0ABU3D606_9FLAO|nr:PA2169 family four-helix-bundle protein [Zunongwangia sp. F117]MDT0676965.1 PA2169 family four-helix-bundle protein [Zunongwangia sp. F117]
MVENKESNVLAENLQELLDRNYDAQEGFKQAMEDTDNHDLKRFLFSKAVRRGEFIAELQKELNILGLESTREGTVEGTAHRAWIGFKTALAGKNDKDVLEECIRGEQIIHKQYTEQLQANVFPEKIEEILRRQMQEIQKTLDEIQTLEDLAQREWKTDTDLRARF